jgi:hypothetical protein
VIAETLASWPRRPALLERMARSLGSEPARLLRPPMPGPVVQRAPRARAADREMMHRMLGYPEGVFYDSPGHALAVQALM